MSLLLESPNEVYSAGRWHRWAWEREKHCLMGYDCDLTSAALTRLVRREYPLPW